MKGTDVGLLMYDLLKDVPGINSRVYPIIAEHGSVTPFIVYARNSLTSTYTKDGIEEDAVNVSLSIVSRDYNESIVITDYIRDILDNYFTDVVTRCRLTGAREQYTDDIGFIQELDYTITIIVS